MHLLCIHLSILVDVELEPFDRVRRSLRHFFDAACGNGAENEDGSFLLRRSGAGAFALRMSHALHRSWRDADGERHVMPASKQGRGQGSLRDINQHMREQSVPKM